MIEVLDPITKTVNHSSNALTENVQILNRVRMVAIVAQITMIAFAVIYLDLKLPLGSLAGVIIVEVLIHGFYVWKVRTGKHFSATELFVQIALDSIILAFLVYYTGGANNPFIYLLLLYVALGSFMLEPKQLILISLLELGLYSLLNLYQRPLELGEQSPLASFHLHLAGMWVNFILTVILLGFFGLVTRYALLRKEKQLQSLRERQLQDEQILGLGIMAASAAHELGTPLATMAIVVEDLEHELSQTEIGDDLKLLAKQIANCKKIIAELGKKSHHAKLQHQSNNQLQASGELTHLRQQLADLIDHWLVYRPNIVLQQHWSSSFAHHSTQLSISVEQAITNLLDNAADASLENQSSRVEVTFSQQDDQLQVDILDFGKGLAIEEQQKLGAEILETNKKDGLGWGMFLSNVSIERVGGRIQLIKSDSGGTLTRISLPLGEQ